ncbi:MAG: hypothetical protein KJZ64_02945 [Sphingomonadaceae bacterium]|nr:hypothetical protein [Sphingomonadaceae bacterium]
MTAQVDVEASLDRQFEPHSWVGQVLDHFARGEQALGKLSIAIGLPISNGSLASLAEVRKRLNACGDRKALMLNKRIERWSANRPFRHLLAHATITILYDVRGEMVIGTRHLPRDSGDVTPDRIWTAAEQKELLRQASNDSRSISDHVQGILASPALIARLAAG